MYDMASSFPSCKYAGIVLLEEKIVSNFLIDCHDMCVKAFINIALVSNRPKNYNANRTNLIRSSGWSSIS